MYKMVSTKCCKVRENKTWERETYWDLIMFLKMFSEEIKISSQWTPKSLHEWTITESPNLRIDSLILQCLSARVTSFSCIYSFLPSSTESLPESVPYCLDFKLIKLWGTTTFLFYISSCLRYIIKLKKIGLIVKETKVPNSTVQWNKSYQLWVAVNWVHMEKPNTKLKWEGGTYF